MNDPFFEEIWQEYHTVRLSGNKKKATKMLSHIIRYLNEKDYVYRKKLVKDICTRFFESADSPIPANNGYDISLSKQSPCKARGIELAPKRGQDTSTLLSRGRG